MPTQKEMIEQLVSTVQEVHQAVLGVPGTEDKGLVGDIKEVKGDVKNQNGRVRRNSARIAIIAGVLAGLGVLGGLEISDVIQLIGG